MELSNRIEIAFKKLKASVYSDKTQLVLRNRIVDYETDGIQEHLQQIETALCSDEAKWNGFEKQLLSSIQSLLFPKKLVGCENSVIVNVNDEKIEIKDPQYFFDSNVDVQILGILWIMYIGRVLDEKMYPHSYGNRLRKNLINADSNEITYSPNLFEPYFKNYESWRDQGLEYAKECLNSKQDALVLTLDFRSFFYSVHFSQKDFADIYAVTKNEEPWMNRINNFVFHVIKQYSSAFDGIYDKRTFLPIGFYPSNVLANWRLDNFDNMLINRWNPVYFGRYVDDIIIVDKIEKNSILYEAAHNGTLDKDTVIEYYFCNCNATKNSVDCCKENRELLIWTNRPEDKEGMNPVNQKLHKKVERIYRVNQELLQSEESNITVQNKKVKAFYFKEGATAALLSCFQSQIAANASEFRLMPDVDAVMTDNNYSEIFNLRRSDTLNKLSGVEDVGLDKFALSKFLGKYLRVGGMINDYKETDFERHLLRIFDQRALIENYTMWEKLFEILVVNARFKELVELTLKIINAITKLEYSSYTSTPANVKTSLLKVFFSALSRSTALTWGSRWAVLFEPIQALLTEQNTNFENSEICFSFVEKLCAQRKKYCLTRMVDKYAMPILIDSILGNSDGACLKEDSRIKLYDFKNTVALAEAQRMESCSYRYYPYMVTPQELAFTLSCIQIQAGEQLYAPDVLQEKVNRLYCTLNYHVEPDAKDSSLKRSIEIKPSAQQENCYAIKVGTQRKGNIRVAIANATLLLDDFICVLTGKANRSYTRYQELSTLLTAAIKAETKLLVLPENYLPIDWLPMVTRICAKNQMAVVTGIEHVLSIKEKAVYNLTAIILPYEQDGYNFSHITFHHKVHYSPEEKRLIKGYRCKVNEGEGYRLFNWNDIWFSVYCCFELASIKDRSLFQSYVDMTIAVEWNKDVNYFSSIIESMSRDLHCYCIQVNSADYGDSRVTKPSKTEERDMLKTKGGINKTILVEDIDVEILREFQRKEYELQREDGKFKTTPPLFDTEVVEKKINGELWHYLNEPPGK